MGKTSKQNSDYRLIGSQKLARAEIASPQSTPGHSKQFRK